MADASHIIEVKHRLITGAPFTAYSAVSRFTGKLRALRCVLDGYRRELAHERPLAATGFRLIPGMVEIYIPDGHGNELCVDNLVEAVLLRHRNLFCGPDISEMRQGFRTMNGLVDGVLRAGVDYGGEGFCLEGRMNVYDPITPNSLLCRYLRHALCIFPTKEQSVAEALATQP